MDTIVWVIAMVVLLLVSVLVTAGCLAITGDSYAGAHTGVDPYPGARHRAVGLDEPTREITRGSATR
jgi:hypothetical protein